MCGIFGKLGGSPIPDSFLERTKENLAHRGPDAQIILARPGLYLGHTLLSIIGDKQVTQPIWSSDKRAVMTFNGEVYNYLELLEEDPDLARICKRRERSDTVVLVEGLRRYGEEFLQRLNGMFAIAFHDFDSGTTLLVRDRLGIKPLFYSQSNNSLIFASECHAIRSLSGQTFEPDYEGLYSYLRFRYPICTRTFDSNIRQIMPGHLLRFRRDGVAENVRWWTNLSAGGFQGSYDEAEATAEDIIRSSIRLRMRSDHDFTSFLSGGLDSSILAAVAAENKELDTYSIGLCGAQSLDESMYSEMVANKLSTRHHPYRLGAEEFREQHGSFVSALKEPIGVPNQVAIKVLSREISRKHRVVLSGEGADEIFAGYGRIFLLPHDWDLICRNGENPREVSDKLLQRYGPKLPSTYMELFLRRYNYTSHEYALELMKGLFTDVDGESLKESIESDFVRLYESIEADSAYNRLLVLFQNIHLPGLLYRLDTATMAHSVEARVPFLDHRLVEFINSLPEDFKLKPLKPRGELMTILADEISEVHDVPKVMLKNMGGKILPSEIVQRKKMGFPIPANFYRPKGGEEKADYEAWTQRNLALLAEAL